MASLLEEERIGANATVLPGERFGREGLAGAGAVVTHDVPAERIVTGIPARDAAQVPPEQMLD